jgi:hypothetical protein
VSAGSRADIEVRGEDGATAADRTRDDEVRELLRAASVRRRKQQEYRALVDAAGRGDVGEVRRLVDEGADLEARTEDGGTALTRAADEGHREVVELLQSASRRQLEQLRSRLQLEHEERVRCRKSSVYRATAAVVDAISDKEEERLKCSLPLVEASAREFCMKLDPLFARGRAFVTKSANSMLECQQANEDFEKCVESFRKFDSTIDDGAVRMRDLLLECSAEDVDDVMCALSEAQHLEQSVSEERFSDTPGDVISVASHDVIASDVKTTCEAFLLQLVNWRETQSHGPCLACINAVRQWQSHLGLVHQKARHDPDACSPLFCSAKGVDDAVQALHDFVSSGDPHTDEPIDMMRQAGSALLHFLQSTRQTLRTFIDRVDWAQRCLAFHTECIGSVYPPSTSGLTELKSQLYD